MYQGLGSLAIWYVSIHMLGLCWIFLSSFKFPCSPCILEIVKFGLKHWIGITAFWVFSSPFGESWLTLLCWTWNFEVEWNVIINIPKPQSEYSLLNSPNKAYIDGRNWAMWFQYSIIICLQSLGDWYLAISWMASSMYSERLSPL